MRTRDILQLALSSLVVYVSCYITFQEEYSFRAINAYKYLADEVFPWLIGFTSVVKLCLAASYLFSRKLPTLPGVSTYIGTAVDVLACFVSLLRINFRYFCLAIFPFLAISFICVLCMRDMSGASGSCTDNGKTERMSRKHNSKKTTVMPRNIDIVDLLRDGLKTRVMPEGFNMAVLMAPHLILSLFGMVGDPDHDGNTYDISNLCLFLTCMLQELTLIMMRLPDTISLATAPGSELLYKASLVVLLVTAHIMVINAFGKKVLLLLLPEVVPPLLWFSIHLDRRSPMIKIQKTMDSEYFVLMPVVVAICGYIKVVSKDGLFISTLNWASMSCFVSGVMTYILLLTLRLWPEEVGMATLSSEEVLNLLTFWGKVLLQATVGLLAFAVLACVAKGNSWFLTVFSQ